MNYLQLDWALRHGFGRRYAQLREAWALEAVARETQQAATQRARKWPGHHGGPVDPHTTAIFENALEGAA